MMKQVRTNTPDKPHEPAAVRDAMTATALDGQPGTGPTAIFYGAARYPFELAQQRELVEDYAETTGLNLVTELHDRQARQDGLGMLLDACQRGGVDYVITAGWPTPNLTTTEAGAVVDQLAQAGTHLVCLNAWHFGDGTPPAWWNDEEGAWMRKLEAMREQERREREQTSQANRVGEGSDGCDAGETGTDSETDNASDDTEPGAICASRDASRITETIEPSKEVHHA